MKFGTTNLISAEAVACVYGDMSIRGGQVLNVQLVVAEVSAKVVGSTSSPNVMEWYRVWFCVPSEKENGDEKIVGGVSGE